MSTASPADRFTAFWSVVVSTFSFPRKRISLIWFCSVTSKTTMTPFSVGCTSGTTLLNRRIPKIRW